MSQFDFNLFFERNLPHFQPPGATLFITFRLTGSLPIETMNRLREDANRQIASIRHQTDGAPSSEEISNIQTKMFCRWDSELDKRKNGALWLGDPAIAEIVGNAIHYLDGKQYVLDAFCIMPNHVHLVCTPIRVGNNFVSVPKIMQSIKGLTARQANLVLNRQGQFWQHESFDHVVRNDKELERIIEYVLYNPTRAGLATEWVYSRFALN